MLKISQNNDNRGRHLEFYSHTGIGNWFQCFPVYPGLNLSSGSGSVSGSGSGLRIPAFPYAQDCLLIFNLFYKCIRIKDLFSWKCQQKEGSSRWTVHYFTIGKVSKCRDFTVLWLVQKIGHWLELTNKQHNFRLTSGCVNLKRTVPRSFRGKYAASFSVT